MLSGNGRINIRYNNYGNILLWAYTQIYAMLQQYTVVGLWHRRHSIAQQESYVIVGLVWHLAQLHAIDSKVKSILSFVSLL